MPRKLSLESHVRAVSSQPAAVWGEAVGHALTELPWPKGITSDLTFLWSAVSHEQAEVLARAGMDSGRLSQIVGQQVTGVSDQTLGIAVSPGVSLPPTLENLALDWIDKAPSSAPAALGVAAFLWNLPEHADDPANAWLGEWLEGLAEIGSSLNVMQGRFDEIPAICALVMHCEVPLFIAYATAAPTKTALREASRGMDSLAELLEAGAEDPTSWLIDGAGYLRAALASVLRSRMLANALGLRPWYAAQRKALSSLLVEAARWSRHDGTQLLGTHGKPPRRKRVWEELASLAKVNRATNVALAASGCIQHGGGSRPREELLEAKLGAPSIYNELAENACMRLDWTHKSGRVAVDFSGTDMRIEARGPKGDGVLEGVWDCIVRRNGKALPLSSGWSEVCWFSDDEVSYLELEAWLDSTIRVQRQILLMREDRLLYLADALLGDKLADWSMRLDLPLAEQVSWEPAERSTEGWLRTPHGARYVFPLFLPEWNRQLALESNWGSITRTGSSLSAAVNRQAVRLYMPIVISLDSRHTRRPITWRKLTVARDLDIVPADEAMAYRLQIGKEQWLFYRSLGPVARRTALGMHTLSDFYAGRFCGEDGTPETLVEVEPSEEALAAGGER